jgi:hypothetical protein
MLHEELLIVSSSSNILFIRIMKSIRTRYEAHMEEMTNVLRITAGKFGGKRSQRISGRKLKDNNQMDVKYWARFF